MVTFCLCCNKVMQCSKTGLLVVFEITHGYAMDAFTCAGCGNSFAISTSQPFYIPIEDQRHYPQIIRVPREETSNV
jgi:hypothetical protein